MTLISEYSSSNYSIIVSLTSSEFYLMLGEVKQAMDILKNIDKGNKYFAIAKIQLGTIYKDRLK